jgi:hypothetical protein
MHSDAANLVASGRLAGTSSSGCHRACTFHGSDDFWEPRPLIGAIPSRGNMPLLRRLTMTKLATVLVCVLAFGCTSAMAQKRPAAQPRSPSANSGSNCGPVTTKTNGSGSRQTTTANCRSGSSNNSLGLPTQGSMASRLLNQRLGKAMPRPGTPDFLPTSNTVSGNQLP